MGLPPAEQSDSIQSFVAEILASAEHERHRRLIVLAGTKEWAVALLNDMQTLLISQEVLSVSESDVGFRFETTRVTGQKIKHFLGQEIDHLIWDGFSGLNPEGLGAASGLLKGGGLFILMLPSLQELTNQPDPDYKRMLGADQPNHDGSTLFLKRLVNYVHAEEHVCLVEQHKNLPQLAVELSGEPKLSNLPTHDQCILIERIMKLATGRARRPIVITADRGRGKSSALGIAAADLATKRQGAMLITGPNPGACDTALTHFKRRTDPDHHDSLTFVPPDELIRNKPEASVLFVDEAASIPAPLLERLLRHYPRIVFSSTIHGYEGTGRGFAVRFLKTLNEVTPNWKRLELKEPVRWAANDPLETFIFKVLCLDADIQDIKGPISPSSTQFEWISRPNLLADETTLNQLFGLLVSAHYQTSPNDLRMILDHPDITLGAVRHTQSQTVIGVIVLIQEGGIADEALAKGIIRGERKPRSHLVPQILTYDSADPELLRLSTLRIMRIAVHPDAQRLGVGSMLLEEATKSAQQKGIDYLSSSFGMTSDLLCFWLNNDFELARIGRHRDAASGLESAVVCRSCSNASHIKLSEQTRSFGRRFCRLLPIQFKNLEPLLVWNILVQQSMDTAVNDAAPLIWEALSESHRAIEDSVPEAQLLMTNYWSLEKANGFDAQTKQALIMKIWQERDWQLLVSELAFDGRKAAEQRCRAALSEMLRAVLEAETRT